MATASARVTRQSGTSFYYAFQVLPAAKRRAIYALYSFCRAVDDCVDEEGGEGEVGLERWLAEVDRCYAGRPTTDLGRDLAVALKSFPIPRGCLEDIVAGCRMDLTTARYETFEDLRVYCRRVASAVGLASIEVFGYKDQGTPLYASELGLALQLTNILRDVGSDAEQILSAHSQRASSRTDGLEALLRFQAERARAHHERARELLPARDRRSLVAAEIMGALYRAILEEVARRGYPLAGPRVRLSGPRKAWIALATLSRTLLPA